MIDRLIHIQDFLNGKSEDELKQAIASKKLDFDTRKYMLVPSERAMCGYTIDFTQEYRNEILDTIQEKSLSKEVLMKIDYILSNGGQFENKETISLYIESEDIIKGNGQKEVIVLKFVDNEGYKETLLCDGKLVKGSLAMVTRTSNFLENKYENLISRQEYATEILGVDPILAAYLTTRLRFLEDNAYDDAILQISDISQKIINNLSLKTLNFKGGIKAELFNNGKNNILNAIIVLLGSNDEMIQLVEKIVGKNTMDNVIKTRDILLCAARQSLKEILLDEQIEEYDDFVNELGEYKEEEFTKNIGIVADVLNLQRDVVQFIVLYGTEQHLRDYLTEVYFDAKTKDIKEVKLPKDIENKIVENCLTEFNINTNISRENIMKVYNIIQKTNLSNQAKKEIIDKYISNITNKEISKQDLKEIDKIAKNKRFSSKEKENRITKFF